MNDQEKAQWLSEFYAEVANGGVVQYLMSPGEWADLEYGPTYGSDPDDWRIKPKVVRYQWLTQRADGRVDMTTQHYSEEEMQVFAARWPEGAKLLRPIEETAREDWE